MTKREMVVKISNETGLIQAHVGDVIQKTFEAIIYGLSIGSNVELRNFGVFEIKICEERKVRNPNSPTEKITVPRKVKVKFKPGKALKDKINKTSKVN